MGPQELSAKFLSLRERLPQSCDKVYLKVGPSDEDSCLYKVLEAYPRLVKSSVFRRQVLQSPRGVFAPEPLIVT